SRAVCVWVVGWCRWGCSRWLRGGRRRLRRRWRRLGRDRFGFVEPDAFVEIEFVGGEERTFATETLGDNAVRVGFAQHHQGMAKSLDIGAVPWLTGHQILADNPRF